MSPSIFEFIGSFFVIIFVAVVIFLIIVILIVIKLLRMNVNEDISKKIDKDKNIVEPTVHLIELSKNGDKKGDKKENNSRVNAQFCTYCGENISKGLKHCPFCGAETK